MGPSRLDIPTDTDRKSPLARPLVLSAARVRKNPFLLVALTFHRLRPFLTSRFGGVDSRIERKWGRQGYIKLGLSNGDGQLGRFLW